MSNRIFFLTPDNIKATGGVKQIYRQVDILNSNGFEAYVLHKKKGFKSKWFENKTKIKYNSKIFYEIKYLLKNKKNKKFIIKINFNYWINQTINFFLKTCQVQFTLTDIIVFPEIYSEIIDKIQINNSKIIFNQNCYYTFNNTDLNIEFSKPLYSDPKIIATIVVSNDSFRYINFVYPNMKLLRIRIGINSNLFSYSKTKKKQIAFMPRKLNEDVVQVINILKFRNTTYDWIFVSIDNKKENEVSEILKNSLIFLSFNNQEGFGMPPVEAMACGCVVVGYHGQGGKEYFKEDFTYLVDNRNIINFVYKIELAIANYEMTPALFIEKGKNASKFVLEKYSLENEKKDILEIWNELLY